LKLGRYFGGESHKKSRNASYGMYKVFSGNGLCAVK
jgi:hypothetical protein